MARRVLSHRTGSADVLEIESVLTPLPANGEVKIRVRAIGLNRAEVNLRAGSYGPTAALANDTKLWAFKKYLLAGLLRAADSADNR
ncbi:MAG TPA: hypothetical protein VHZ55_29855 [Bryobacteraceae bacterium]|jgi:NADPH:quinone reductase-like Zn-dependent oxidoreductase|nr:hypothetical protein [Bryobacteraceae bacterium]